jgi:hypothetical protein
MHFSITNRFDLTIGVHKPRSLVVLNSTLSIIKGEQVLRSTELSSTIQIEEKNFDDLQKL